MMTDVESLSERCGWVVGRLQHRLAVQKGGYVTESKLRANIKKNSPAAERAGELGS